MYLKTRTEAVVTNLAKDVSFGQNLNDVIVYLHLTIKRSMSTDQALSMKDDHSSNVAAELQA